MMMRLEVALLQLLFVDPLVPEVAVRSPSFPLESVYLCCRTSPLWVEVLRLGGLAMLVHVLACVLIPAIPVVKFLHDTFREGILPLPDGVKCRGIHSAVEARSMAYS